MKSCPWGHATAIVVGAAVTVLGQGEIPSASSTNSSYVQSSKLVGRKVKSSEGKEIGVIKDIVIDRSNGCMAYTVLSTGGGGSGVISGAGKIVAVPWALYSPTSDLNDLTVNVTRNKIYDAPTFEYARMDEYARPDYMNNVYSYYGVSSGPRTAVATGTDVTGTAGATASPGEVASPAAAPAETGSPNKKPSARKHTSSAANSDGTTGANSSPKAVTVRTFRARSSIDRGETTLPMAAGEFPSESTTGANENKRSRRKAIQDISTRKPSTTPESADGQN